MAIALEQSQSSGETLVDACNGPGIVGYVREFVCWARCIVVCMESTMGASVLGSANAGVHITLVKFSQREHTQIVARSRWHPVLACTSAFCDVMTHAFHGGIETFAAQ